MTILNGLKEIQNPKGNVMIFDFKKSKSIYILLVVLSIIAVALLFGGLQPGSTATPSLGIYVENKVMRTVFSLLTVIPLIVLSAAYAEKIARREHDKLIRILDMECNPKKFLNSYAVIAGRTSRYEATRRQKRVYLALGYMEDGNLEKAIAVLNKVRFVSDTVNAKKLCVLGHGTLCHCYLRLGDTSNGAKMLDCYQKAVSALKADDMNAWGFELLEQEVLKSHLAFLQESPQDVLPALLKAMVESPTIRQQVNASYLAALVCMKRDEPDKAKDYLAFVVNNGNSLWAKSRAGAIIADLQGQQ